MNRDIIVVGASAGGVDALRRFVCGLPANLPASVFVTLHMPLRTPTVLPQILSTHGPLPASIPEDGELIRHQHIYVAPPDYHLLFTPDHVHLGHGPKENMQRPCINTMFRSAAEVFGARVIGVVLSGMLDDGAAGLWEIQQKGGLTLVQEPLDAAYKSMPESAIRGLDVDHILPVTEMTQLLVQLTQQPAKRKGFDEGGEEAVRGKNNNLEPSTQSCPLCGGVMQRATLGRTHEYLCHTGHRYGPKTIIAEKISTVERAAYVALAQLEELIVLLQEVKSDTSSAAAADLNEEILARQKEAQIYRELVKRHPSLDLEAASEVELLQL